MMLWPYDRVNTCSYGSVMGVFCPLFLLERNVAALGLLGASSKSRLCAALCRSPRTRMWLAMRACDTLASLRASQSCL